METVIYLILAVLVLTVLLTFFLTQEGPAERQIRLEAPRSRSCLVYQTDGKDLNCLGNNDAPVSTNPRVLVDIGTACRGLNEFGYSYPCNTVADLQCIQGCCCRR